MYSGGGEISNPSSGNSRARQNQPVAVPGPSRRQAYVKILEQPASKALRFRYECEGRSAGSIPGASSTPENKTFPAIQVVGYQGKAVVVVSCVTKDPPYRPHPHNLVGREGCRRGVCTLEVSPESMAVTFSNLGIQCVKKKDIEDALKVREEIRVDPFRTGFSHRNQPTSIDLNAVRLCFQVFLEGDSRGKFTVPLPPVVSDPIYDKKAMSDLVICKLSDCNCLVTGGKEIILLCEKVAKEDIQVRFFEENNGNIIWEALGDFQPAHVHKQVAISFRTPRYRTLETTEAVKVFVQLRRPSDGATSDCIPFEYQPLDAGRPAFWSLRRAIRKKGDYNVFSSILSADARSLSGNKNIATLQKMRLNNGSSNLFQVQNKIDESETEQQHKTLLETNFDNDVNDTVEIVAEWKKETKEGEVTKKQEEEKKPHWCDYTEVENIQTVEEKVMNDKTNNNNTEEKSLNDLLNQVAELDEIYSDTQARLMILTETNNNEPELTIDKSSQSMEIESFDDSGSYSSLQMAFKNPIEINMQYDDALNVQGPLIDVSPLKRESDSEKLPPLPPKRIKKTPNTPVLGYPVTTDLGSSHSIPLISGSQTIRTSNPNLTDSPVKRSISYNSVTQQSDELSAPIKKLPPTPCSTLPNPKKQSFFSKLFSKKPKKDNRFHNASVNDLNSQNTFDKTRSASVGGGSLCNISNSNRDESVTRISLNPTPPGSMKDDNKTGEFSIDEKTNGDFNDDDIITLDLTDAEHYALYTAMAPHATSSEFDEMSCYYSPVEGGKVLTPAEMEARIQQTT